MILIRFREMNFSTKYFSVNLKDESLLRNNVYYIIKEVVITFNIVKDQGRFIKLFPSIHNYFNPNKHYYFNYYNIFS